MNIKIFTLFIFISNICYSSLEDIFGADLFQKNFSSYADLPTALNLRLTSKKLKKASDFIIQVKYDPFISHLGQRRILYLKEISDNTLIIKPHSSVIDNSNIRETFYKYASQARHKLIIVSDQITDSMFMNRIADFKRNQGIDVSIMCGDNPHDKITLIDFSKKHNITYSSRTTNVNRGRMHNKFMLVDDYGVILGSPNITTAAFENNIESYVAIYNIEINTLYNQYYDYLNTPEREGMLYLKRNIEVSNAINNFNNNDKFPIKVCFANIESIRDFIKKSIDRCSFLAISMFLMRRSQNDPNNDVINKLAKLIKGEIVLNSGEVQKTVIDIQVDADQFKQIPRLSEPLKMLKSFGVKLSTIKPHSNGVLHDKLFVFAKDSSVYTIIGSAGITSAVENNENSENMISIEDAKIGLFFRKHILAIQSGKVAEVNII